MTDSKIAPAPKTGSKKQLPAVIDGKAEIVTQPDWTHVQDLIHSLKLTLTFSVAIQVRIGQELFALKRAHGFIGSGSHKKKTQNPNDSVFKTWSQLVEHQTGRSSDTADNWIKLYESAKLRLKKIGGEQHLALLMDSDPAHLSKDHLAKLETLTQNLVDGSSQKELLAELKLSKKVTSIGGKTDIAALQNQLDALGIDYPVDATKEQLQALLAEALENQEEPPLSQLAFGFFSPIADSLINLRIHSDYQTLLHNLPEDSLEPSDISLTTLEREFKAALQDIAQVRAANAAKVAAVMKR